MLSVVEPNATGIGGDCFTIISMNGKKPVSYNGSGIAPEKAKVDFFIKNKINKIGLDSPHSVTVPGAVRVLVLIIRKKNKNLCIYKELLYDSINN